MLPLEWWKLSFIWLTQTGSRTPPARKGLLSNSFHSSVLGLALSVAALSVTLAIFTGFEGVLARSISASLGHVTHFTRWRPQAELDDLIKRAPPGVVKAVSFWTSQGLIVGPKGGRGVMIEGRRGTGVEVPEDSPVLVDLGKPLAETLGLKTGDSFRILLPGIIKGSVDARVHDILEYGMHDIDSRLAIVIDESLRPVIQRLDPESYANRPGDGHGVRYALSSDPENLTQLNAWMQTYRKDIEAAGLEDNTAIYRSWKDLQKNLLGSIGLDKKVLVVLMGLLTLVATLNVAATLVVLFLERDREMAVLRALGLSPRKMVVWIGIQGFLMGLIASGLGLLLGRFFGFVIQKLPWAQLPSEIYHIHQLPLTFDFREQGVTFLFGIATACGIAVILGRQLAHTKLLNILGQRR